MDSKVNWLRWLALAGLIACVTPDVYAVLAISGGSASSVRPVSLVVSDSGGDYTTIEAAIAALPVGGATIMVKRGSYTPAGMLTVPSNVTIEGEGRDTTIIHSANSVTAAVTLGGPDATLRNLQIDGATNTAGGIGVIVASGAHRCRIVNCWIRDTVGGHGVSIASANDTTVENSRITNGGTAASTIMSSPALTNSGNAIFWVGPGMAGKFTAGQAIKVGTQSATISAIKALKTYVSVGTSTAVFDVLDPTGFANGDVIRVGPVVATISTVSSNTITLTGALTSKPTPGQIVAIDRITLTSTLGTTTAGQLVTVVGGFAKGILATTASRTTVRGCYLTGWSQGIGYWFGAVDGTIDGCTLVDNYGYEEAAHTTNRSAIELYPLVNVGHNRVVNTVIDGSTHNCVEIAQGETASVLQNLVVSNWASEAGLGSGIGYGVEFAGASGQINLDCAVLNSTFASNGAFATQGVVVNDKAYNTKIAFNTFTGFSGGSTSYPIVINTAVTPLIAHNTFEYNSRDIFVNGSTAVGVIEDNRSTQPAYNAGISIDLQSAGDGWRIDKNIIDWSSVVGSRAVLIQSGGKHIVTGNNLKADYAPLKITDYCMAQGNTLVTTHDGEYGLHVNGNYNLVTGNRLDAASTSDLHINTGADYNVVVNNYLVHGSTHTTGMGTHNLIAASWGTAPIILPTSCTGQASGMLYNNAGTPAICP